jgi:hypothetical protein
MQGVLILCVVCIIACQVIDMSLFAIIADSLKKREYENTYKFASVAAIMSFLIMCCTCILIPIVFKVGGLVNETPKGFTASGALNPSGWSSSGQSGGPTRLSQYSRGLGGSSGFTGTGTWTNPSAPPPVPPISRMH